MVLLALAPLLGGCMQTLTGSVAGGECKIFERPTYAVLGKRPYDQDWIDSQVEGGVGGCNWPRPAPRPASLDAAPVKPSIVSAKPKPGFVKRVTARVRRAWPKGAVAPIDVPIVPVPAASVAPASPSEPPEKPRSAIDELLQPSR